MQTAKLDEILRQKDPMLKETVEQLARGDVRGGIANLEQQGRVHEIVNPQERFGAIAREYARKPEGTLVISPDNESRRELNCIRTAKYTVDGGARGMREVFRSVSWPPRFWA